MVTIILVYCCIAISCIMNTLDRSGDYRRVRRQAERVTRQDRGAHGELHCRPQTVPHHEGEPYQGYTELRCGAALSGIGFPYIFKLPRCSTGLAILSVFHIELRI